MSRIRMLLLVSAALPLAACGADDVASPGEGVIVVPAPTPTPTPGPTPTPTPTPTPVPADCPSGTTNAGTINSVNGERRVCQISGRISSNLALAKVPGAIYSLSGRVDVGTDVGGDGNAAGGNGVTLTIDPGVVIFASSGNDFLVVNRGSRLVAEGTSTNPIVFTARSNVVGTATDSSQSLWGGVVMLGRAPISDCLAGATGGAADCQQQIEGTSNALYGGNVAADNSGSLRYVQIRYSGFAIAAGNELQGLTTGGVGSGTTFDYVQVHNSSDDGVEFFGGRHNFKHLIVTGADDDSIDTDLGYKGFIQYVIAVHRDSGNGDSMIEADSNGNEDATPRQNTRLANFTFVHRSTTQGLNAMLLRGGTDYTMVNGVVTAPGTVACLDIDGATTVQATGPDEAGPPVFQSVFFSCGTPFRDDGNLAATQAPFAAGANNVSAGTSSLTGVFINGANEAAVTAFAASTLGSFFENTTYIGAVRDANDTWYRGWTCDSGYAPFGSNSLCTALPAGA
jgi:hypothetical protein